MRLLNNILEINMRMFEVEFYDTSKRIMFAKNRQEIWKKFPGDVYCINRIVVI